MDTDYLNIMRLLHATGVGLITRVSATRGCSSSCERTRQLIYTSSVEQALQWKQVPRWQVTETITINIAQ